MNLRKQRKRQAYLSRKMAALEDRRSRTCVAKLRPFIPSTPAKPGHVTSGVIEMVTGRKEPRQTVTVSREPTTSDCDSQEPTTSDCDSQQGTNHVRL